MYGEGISREGELIDLGITFGFVQRSGAWFYLGGDPDWSGPGQCQKVLKENPDVAAALAQDIKAAAAQAKAEGRTVLMGKKAKAADKPARSAASRWRSAPTILKRTNDRKGRCLNGGAIPQGPQPCRRHAGQALFE